MPDDVFAPGSMVFGGVDADGRVCVPRPLRPGPDSDIFAFKARFALLTECVEGLVKNMKAIEEAVRVREAERVRSDNEIRDRLRKLEERIDG